MDAEDIAEVVKKLGRAKVKLVTAYLATNTRLVLGADNLADAKAAFDWTTTPPE